ncbi:glycosyltransferase family 1 protein [Hypoxylon cercidicola]|nr:glycosyltransferase family 1 protein [Hypoxylon cercidicola]
MASQPQRSRKGQEIPGAPASNKSSPTEAFSSGTEPGNNNNPILPRIGTVEQPPSPTVDNVDSEPNPSLPFIREPQRSVAEMERDRESVLTTAFKKRLVPVSMMLARAAEHAWFGGSKVIPTGIIVGMLCVALVFSWHMVMLITMAFVVFRHCILVFRRHHIEDRRVQNSVFPRRGAPGVFLVICGSGGHTSEMLRMLLRSIRIEEIGHRRWAIGADDPISFQKVLKFEQRIGNLQVRGAAIDTFNIASFNRARHVHQGWSSTLATATKCICNVIEILIVPPTRQRPYFQFPNVIVTNGPGTGFLFLLVAHILKVLCIVPEPFMKTIYVESWARVNTLSLTGKLVKLFQVADMFIVQHRQLADSDDLYFTSNMVAMPTVPYVRIPRPPSRRSN